jgi:hypothetical protein
MFIYRFVFLHFNIADRAYILADAAACARIIDCIMFIHG